jgi:hypothetical protein
LTNNGKYFLGDGCVKLPKLGSPPVDAVQNFGVPVFWGTTDAQKVDSLFRETISYLTPGIHVADNFLTWCRNNSMLDDPEFVRAWESNCLDRSDRAVVWRRYILATSAYHCVQLEGDFVECGCYRGIGVKTVVDYLGGTEFPKTFWGYDLFVHDENEVHEAMAGHGADLYDQVLNRFNGYDQVKIIKGRIPEVFEGQSPDKIAYLHIDLNQAPAEIAALEALFDRVVPGGMIILDDYEWAIYRAQKLAEDNWFEARNYRVMPLPTGQGLITKR